MRKRLRPSRNGLPTINADERASLESAKNLVKQKQFELNLLQHGLSNLLRNLHQKYKVSESCVLEVATGKFLVEKAHG